MASKKFRFGDLQPTLAVGYEGSRSLVLRPWNGAAERALAALRDSMGPTIKARPMLYLSTILATLVVKFGERELWRRSDSGQFEPIGTDAERLFMFDSAWMPDIQMALFFARRKAHGAEYMFPSSVPGAGANERIRADLDECEVTIVDSVDDARSPHKFSQSATVRNEMADGVIVGPARWGAITALTSTNAASISYAAIFSSVHEVPGTKIKQPVMTDFDELSRSEIRKLAEATDLNAVGIDLSVDVDTDQGGVHKATVNWLSPDFFTDSSPSGGFTRSGRMSFRSSTSVDSLKM